MGLIVGLNFAFVSHEQRTYSIPLIADHAALCWLDWLIRNHKQKHAQ